jgi:hypothetical protein
MVKAAEEPEVVGRLDLELVMIEKSWLPDSFE